MGQVGSGSTHLAYVGMIHFALSAAVAVWIYVSPQLEGANWKIYYIAQIVCTI